MKRRRLLWWLVISCACLFRRSTALARSVLSLSTRPHHIRSKGHYQRHNSSVSPASHLQRRLQSPNESEICHAFDSPETCAQANCVWLAQFSSCGVSNNTDIVTSDFSSLSDAVRPVWTYAFVSIGIGLGVFVVLMIMILSVRKAAGAKERIPRPSRPLADNMANAAPLEMDAPTIIPDTPLESISEEESSTEEGLESISEEASIEAQPSDDDDDDLVGATTQGPADPLLDVSSITRQPKKHSPPSFVVDPFTEYPLAGYHFEETEDAVQYVKDSDGEFSPISVDIRAQVSPSITIGRSTPRPRTQTKKRWRRSD